MSQNVVTLPNIVTSQMMAEWRRIAETATDRRVWLSRDLGQCEQCLRAGSESSAGNDCQIDAPVIVLTVPNDPARQASFLETVSPTAALIAASCEDDMAVGLTVEALQQIGSVESATVDGLVVALSVTEKVSFQVAHGPAFPAIRRPPALTTIGIVPRDPIIHHWIEREVVARPLATTTSANADDSTRTEKTALRAGLLLLAGFIDESHAASQSIEGKGRPRSGDYWHAILHRREPDYGNAKYWFRSVGRHPNAAELSELARRMLQQASRPQDKDLAKWESRLMSEGWNPAAFVDLCQAAEHNPSLRVWCEELQFQEMILLLTSTYREVVMN